VWTAAARRPGAVSRPAARAPRWRVASQPGQFNTWKLLSLKDTVTVVFEKVEDEPATVPAGTAGADTAEVEKVCPDCAQTVKAAANVCRYCGFRFSESAW
jgi:hypothetical protein